ncbi:BadM/Rrf2 family transcriptional regulator [Azonexus fungiphilus]|uniref:BadM/Rrf2 family transcriptional regulator n=1 Tax=Azonexus fungiphilus TaxID=146940 RepID=A0A495WML6_9RHOO|nr:Rrf2 family transcriptional regulator [Azonexus fungiphilus]RKT62962.1 BadM/Rrf2 family transcriptional regulator [Azonexus fungiphilus]
MRLSSFSDYSLRVLMYLGVHAERLVTIGEIAEAYGISANHLTKVVHQLGRLGYLETLRGKGGGIRLGRPAGEIRLGELIRQVEGDWALVECFATGGNCQIHGACRLPPILDEALAAMFAALDRHTLAELLVRPRELGQALPLRRLAG